MMSKKSRGGGSCRRFPNLLEDSDSSEEENSNRGEFHVADDFKGFYSAINPQFQKFDKLRFRGRKPRRRHGLDSGYNSLLSDEFTVKYPRARKDSDPWLLDLSRQPTSQNRKKSPIPNTDNVNTRNQNQALKPTSDRKTTSNLLTSEVDNDVTRVDVDDSSDSSDTKNHSEGDDVKMDCDLFSSELEHILETDTECGRRCSSDFGLMSPIRELEDCRYTCHHRCRPLVRLDCEPATVSHVTPKNHVIGSTNHVTGDVLDHVTLRPANQSSIEAHRANQPIPGVFSKSHTIGTVNVASSPQELDQHHASDTPPHFQQGASRQNSTTSTNSTTSYTSATSASLPTTPTGHLSESRSSPDFAIQNGENHSQSIDDEHLCLSNGEISKNDDSSEVNGDHDDTTLPSLPIPHAATWSGDLRHVSATRLSADVCGTTSESRGVQNAYSTLPLRQRLDSYNENHRSTTEALQLTGTNTFQGFIRVWMNLSRPINMYVGVRPPSIYQLLAHEDVLHDKQERIETMSFYIPRNTIKSLHISSDTPASDVVSELLQKFKITDSPRKFALYEQATDPHTAQVTSRKLGESDRPLELVLAWEESGRSSHNKLVLQENETGDIVWEAFSEPELQNFLRILHREEEEHIEQIRTKFKLLKLQLNVKLRNAQPKSDPDTAVALRHCDTVALTNERPTDGDVTPTLTNDERPNDGALELANERGESEA